MKDPQDPKDGRESRASEDRERDGHQQILHLFETLKREAEEKRRQNIAYIGTPPSQVSQGELWTEHLSPEQTKESLGEIVSFEEMRKAYEARNTFQKTGNPISDALGEYFFNYFQSHEGIGGHLELDSETFFKEHGKPLLATLLNAFADSLLKDQETQKEETTQEERELNPSELQEKTEEKEQKKTQDALSIQVDLTSFIQWLFQRK